jgi:tRNA(Ile)-lysidine synthase
MLERFLHYNFSLFDQKKVIAAISGGIDSMVMLQLLSQSTIDVHVCYVDHHTRNGTSSQDAMFLKEYCRTLKVPITIDHYHHYNGNFQSQARDFRYEFFRRIKESEHADFILTAHHLGDSIESFLHHAIRGTGIKGLRGIQYRINDVVRPLLHFSKDEIDRYAHEAGIPYVIDVSNYSSTYNRNKIRQSIIPQFQTIMPHFEQRMKKTLNEINNDYDLLSKLIEEKKTSFVTHSGDEVYIDLDYIKQHDYGPALFQHLMGDYGFTKVQASNCLASRIGSLFRSPEYVCNKDRDKVILKSGLKEGPDEIIIDGAGKYPISKYKAILVELAEPNSVFTENVVYLDKNKLNMPLKGRKWRSGDVIHPNGMKGKSKKISKLLKDLKIPRIKKNEIYVLESSGKICCIPGIRGDEYYKSSANSEEIYKVSVVDIE